MGQLTKAGAVEILKHMVEHGFRLFGDPSRDVPWFFLPTDLNHKVFGSIDLPASRDCVELLRRKLIQAEDSTKQGKQTFRVSESDLGTATSN